MDADQNDRLAKLAARGRVSRSAPAAAPRATAPVPPPPPAAPVITSSFPAAPVGFAPPDARLRIDALTTAAVIVERDPSVVRQERRARSAGGAAPLGAMPLGIEPRPASAIVGGRKRHAALAGRIVAAGMTTSAFLGGLASLAAAPPPAWEKNAKTSANEAGDQAVDTTAVAADPATPATTAAPVQDTVYVVQKVPRVVYVDQNGNPVDPNATIAPVAEAAVDAPAEEPAPEDPSAPTPATAKPKAKAASPASPGAPAPAAPASPGAPAAPTPPAATAAPTPAPTPAAPAPTPAPTAAPKPKAPPTTAACTGSKCP